MGIDHGLSFNANTISLGILQSLDFYLFFMEFFGFDLEFWDLVVVMLF
jgi:hypothetical protein